MPLSTAMPPSPKIAQAFTPTGKLRASINLGNPILANRDPKTGEPFGISIDMARAFAEQLGADLELQVFDTAAKSVDAVTRDEADIGFFAIDPARGEGISFTAAYVLIEGSYMVRTDSPIQSKEEVDKPGHRVTVGKGSAYDLFLTRAIKQAAIVRAASSQAVVETFLISESGGRSRYQAGLARGSRPLPGHAFAAGPFHGDSAGDGLRQRTWTRGGCGLA